MNNNDIFVMGCGASINKLTAQEKQHINNAQVRLAMNRFTMFYKDAGIIPTHIYFIDFHTKTAAGYIQSCIDIVKENEELKDVTFIFSKKIKNRLYPKKTIGYHLQVLNPFNYYIIKKPRLIMDYSANIDFVKYSHYLKPAKWANNFDEKLLLFRSSLTAALNYSTIKFKPAAIKLIGVDLSNSGYFFEDKLDISKDLVRNAQKKLREKEIEQKKHITVIDLKGTNMLDEFPYVVNSIKERGFEFYNCNKKSLLVQENYMDFKPVEA